MVFEERPFVYFVKNITVTRGSEVVSPAAETAFKSNCPFVCAWHQLEIGNFRLLTEQLREQSSFSQQQVADTFFNLKLIPKQLSIKDVASYQNN